MNCFKSLIPFACVLLFLGSLASCTDDNDLADIPSSLQSSKSTALIAQSRSVENDSTEVDEDFMCFTIEYPISFTLPDGGSQSVNSDEELDNFLDVYYAEADETTEDPQLSYPITVTIDGTAQEIANDESLETLLEICDEMYEDYEGNYEYNEEECFTYQYPISYTLSDGANQVVNNDEEHDTLFEQWYESADSSTQYPGIVYPFTVIVDGNASVINNDAEYESLFENCDDAYGDYDDEDFYIEDCFTFVFPIDVVYADGRIETITNEAEFEETCEDVDSDNQDADIPEIVFPIEITWPDSTMQSIVSLDALLDLYEACEDAQGESQDDDDSDDGTD